jgi:outer membrane protein assembly factor BamB
VRALHALMPVLVVGQMTTASGTRQVGYVSGISDNLYAFDTETGKILWQRHW